MRKTTAFGLVLALVAMVFAVIPMNVGAATIIVPDDYPTIQDAVDAASPGDNIYVKAGTYYEKIVVDKALTIQGEDKYTTIIDSGGTGTCIWADADWVTVSGFTLTNSMSYMGFDAVSVDNCCASNLICVGHYIGIRFSDADYGYIVNNTCYNNTSSGIHAGYWPYQTQIENNTCEQNGDWGIALGSGTETVISNNMCNLNGDGGIYLYNSSGNEVSWNIAVNNNGFGIRLLSGSNGNNIINNNCSANTLDGINLGFSSNNTILNNFVDQNGVNAIRMASSSNNSIAYNYLSLNSGRGIYLTNCDYNLIDSNLVQYNNDDGIYMFDSSSYNMVVDNLCDSNAFSSISLHQSSNYNMIADNILKNGNRGVRINGFSNLNYFVGNYISNNNVGISLQDAHNNNFYYNSIVNNLAYQVFSQASWNIWDNGAGEGNHWSDYAGLDDGSGGRIAGDGIGDTEIPHPYVDQGNGYFQLDNYPIMHPYGYTPVGTDVWVYLGNGVSVHFNEVTDEGFTTLEVSTSNPGSSNPGFKFMGNYYNIETNAAYTGGLEIWINYDDTGLTPGQENNLKLFHWEDPDWVPLPTGIDTVNNIIWGYVDHLSWFAAAYPDVVNVTAIVDFDPDTLNLKSNGKWITCYIELKVGHDVNDIDVSTVAITDINGVPVNIPAESHPTSVGDEDEDGIPDLMVKFDRSDVQDACSPGDATITISGQLTGGTTLSGSDTITVIDPP